MLQFKEIIGSTIDRLLMVVWAVIKIDIRCIFQIRSGMYRTALRAYNNREGHVGLATVAFINIFLCYLIFSSAGYNSLDRVFQHWIGVTLDNHFLPYILLSFVVFSLVSFSGIALLVRLADKLRVPTSHLNISQFKFLCFFPHLVVSIALLMLVLLAVAFAIGSRFFNIEIPPNNAAAPKIIWAPSVVFLMYVIVIGPHQVLHLFRKGRSRRVNLQRATYFCGSALVCVAAYAVGVAVAGSAYRSGDVFSGYEYEATRSAVKEDILCENDLKRNGVMVTLKVRNAGVDPVRIYNAYYFNEDKKITYGEMDGDGIVVDGKKLSIVRFLIPEISTSDVQCKFYNMGFSVF